MKDKRLYHSVSKKIMKLITDGVFPPGSRLPGERELAERFSVSRVTIREAEIALQAIGHIQIKTGSGVYVLDSSAPRNGGLPDVTAFELTEARLLFESEAAAQAAISVDDETLEKLHNLIGEMTKSGEENTAAAEAADREFHLTIAAASGNAVVKYIVEMLWKIRTEVQEVKTVYQAVCSEDDTRGEEHMEIFVALSNHDQNAARIAMRKHFRRLLESMLDATEEQALEDLRKSASESRKRFLKDATL